MQEHGMCILRGLFPPQAVVTHGTAACAVGTAAHAAMEADAESLEVAGEIFNVNEDKFTVMSPALGEGTESLALDHPVIVSILEAVSLEPWQQPATGSAQEMPPAGPRLVQSAMRRSESLLQAQSVGGVIALPKAPRQAIHPDGEHLYEHVHLPPHYTVLFLPAAAPLLPVVVGGDTTESTHTADERELATAQAQRAHGFALGQTAFLLGSHVLGVGAGLLSGGGAAGMVSAAGEDGDTWRSKQRGRRLVRPHCEPGDALLFDARLLHWGMANASPTHTRPLLYVNYHRPWFADYQPGGQIIVRHRPLLRRQSGDATGEA
jgi:hypothetical protein